MISINIKKSTDYILNSINIVEYLSKYYNISFKKYGSNMRAICPLHHDTDPSFTVKIGKNVFYCFGCKAGGSLITFVEKKENQNRMSAILTILNNIGIDISQFTNDEYVDSSGIMDAAHKIFMSQQSEIFDKFFKNKGFSIDWIRSAGVGWSESADLLIDKLSEMGFSRQEIFRYGLGLDFYNQAIVYPIYNSSGLISYFSCRKFGDIKYISGNDSIPTYESDLLIGIHKLKSNQDVIIVEGYNDWLALNWCGINAVAMEGLKINDNAIRSLTYYDNYNFYFWVDGDIAGYEFLTNITKMYGELFIKHKVNAYAIFVKDFDPDQLILSGFDVKKAINEAVLLPIFYIKNKYQNFNNWSSRIKVVDEIVSLCKDYDLTMTELMIREAEVITGLSYNSIQDRYYQSNNDRNIDFRVESILISCILHDDKIIHNFNITDDLFATNSCKTILSKVKSQGLNHITIRNDAPDWLLNFIDSLPNPDFNVIDECVLNLRELQNRRKVVDVAKSLINGGSSIDETIQRINDLTIQINNDDMYSMISIGDAMKSAVDNIVSSHKQVGYSLGQLWPITNNTILGICPKRLILVAGNTGHGKTSLALNWIYWLSFVGNYKGLIFTGEMDNEEVSKRLISIATGVAGTDIISNNVKDTDIDKIFKLITDMDPNCLQINETMDFNQIINIIKYSVIKHGTKYVVLDYIQLVQVSKYMQQMSRPMQLCEMTTRLKRDICKKLGIPVIVLAQLADQGLDDPIPTARRLSQSKLMEADADVSIALRLKTEREMQVDSRGNMIFHIDKVRYNKRNVVIPILYSDINLSMREC